MKCGTFYNLKLECLNLCVHAALYKYESE
jgi:hypothetical protein